VFGNVGEESSVSYEIRPVEFDSPPVAEVALSLQTAPIPGIQTAHMGAFWSERLREKYPIAQDQPAVPPSLESFDEKAVWTPNVTFSMGVGRHWHLSSDQTWLVQIQGDRLVLNWRRLETQDYPHYARLRAELQRVSAEWTDFLGREDLPKQPVLQAEVTYINQVPIEEPLADASDIGALLSSVQPSWPNQIGKPESIQLEQRFSIMGPSGQPSRLYITVVPGLLSSGQQYLSLNFVARGKPARPTVEESLDWMDFAHNQITNTFAGVTTEVMRGKWGQRHDERRNP